MRASAIVERSGIPTASLVCDGFVGQGAAVSPGLGIADLPIARIPGHVDGQSPTELRDNLRAVTVPAVVDCLTRPPDRRGDHGGFAPGTIVARGDTAEINRIFAERQWSDGLPIVPPTQSRVDAFLSATDDPPGREIGILQPSGAMATVLNVAVNGVMANCRPEHMPVLIAIAEVLADPGYGMEHSGDTTGGDALVILSGPRFAALGFNCAEGALRDGHRANTSVGRFVRLMQRNVARSLPGGGDKATFGHTWNVALLEHDAAAGELGWPGFGLDRGFAAEDDIVTVGRFTGSSVVGSIYGSDPQEIARYLANGLVRQSGWELVFTVGFARGTYRPLLVVSPMVARTLARAGVGKKELRALLYRHARLPARQMEHLIGTWSNLVPGRPALADLVAAGSAAPQFAESDDPDRLVPIVERPEDILLVLSGDPLRSNAVAFASNGMHGFPTSKKVRFRGER